LLPRFLDALLAVAYEGREKKVSCRLSADLAFIVGFHLVSPKDGTAYLSFRLTASDFSETSLLPTFDSERTE